jgi:hypothetical protein
VNIHITPPIGFDPDLPLTGSQVEDWSAEANATVVAALDKFKRIYIHVPWHGEFHSRCDFLLKLGQSTRGEPQKGLRVLAPSGSGKTTAARMFMGMVEAATPRTDDFVPVVLVPLERATTTKKLMTAILTAFGDPFASSGTEVKLKSRVYACFERLGTRLLIIDEVQHLRFRSTVLSDATDTLKRLLDDGVLPIVFLGTDDAQDMFTRNLQFNGRLLPPCDFKRLDPKAAIDRSHFKAFLEELDVEIHEAGILPMKAGLHNPRIAGCLHAIADGVIGRVSRLLFVALEIALRRGADCIEVYDLALATDRWALPQGFVKSNPFRSGSNSYE